MRIFINPGHCPGVDSGAVGNGLIEAEVALKIGEKVCKYLDRVGYETKLFQYDGLRRICDEANHWNSDIFVSIHCNSAASSAAHGTETFYWNWSGAGKKLARSICNEIVDAIPITNRGTKTANFTVLAYTDAPAVLVETAFINNPGDARLLVEYEDEFARAIARGVTTYARLGG